MRAGETVGVVGESGSGKSTLGRAILRLQPASGLVRFEDRNLMPLDRAAMRPLRRHLQLVFQDPFGSLSPRMTAGEIVTEGLLVHEPSISRKERDRRAAQAFEEVRLDPAWRNRFPHEFSGGQRQRIAIARAMILHPKLVVLDEPTSALDRSVQKEIVELLRDLQKAHGLAYVFISHDLAVVRALSDEIMVMKSGKVVERGTAEEIFDRPQRGLHPRSHRGRLPHRARQGRGGGPAPRFLRRGTGATRCGLDLCSSHDDAVNRHPTHRIMLWHHGKARSLSRQARLHENLGAGRQGLPAPRRLLRRAEARCLSPPLRFPP